VRPAKQIPQLLQIPVVGVASMFQFPESVGGVSGPLHRVARWRSHRRDHFARDPVVQLQPKTETTQMSAFSWTGSSRSYQQADHRENVDGHRRVTVEQILVLVLVPHRHREHLKRRRPRGPSMVAEDVSRRPPSMIHEPL
jgi:hypothetical protein